MRSKGNEELIKMLREIFPGYLIKPEYHIGERLRLDAYIRELNTGCEFDGIQHFEYIPFFHETPEDLEEAQKRDRRKEELCREQGITFIRISFEEK